MNEQSAAFLEVASSLTAKVEVFEQLLNPGVEYKAQVTLKRILLFFDELTRVQWMSTIASADDAFGEQESTEDPARIRRNSRHRLWLRDVIRRKAVIEVGARRHRRAGRRVYSKPTTAVNVVVVEEEDGRIQ